MTGYSNGYFHWHLTKNNFEKKHFENNRRLFWPVKWWVIVGMSHSLYTNTAYNLTTSTKWLYSKFKKCKLNKTWNCHHHWMLKPPKSDHKQILLQLFNYLYSICLDFLIKFISLAVWTCFLQCLAGNLKWKVCESVWKC